MNNAVSDFKLRFPELAHHEEADIELAFADMVIFNAYVGPVGKAYGAAHLLVLSDELSKGLERRGEIVAEAAGDLLVRYKSQSSSRDGASNRDVFFTRTEYGRRFLVLEQRSKRWLFSGVVE